MNRARVAALLREQARIATELAEEFEADGDVPAEAPSRAQRNRRPPAMVRPAGEPKLPSTPALATKLLRERGYR